MSAKALIHLVAGARPNFVKIAPLWHALRKANWCDVRIVHTGQHADINMSDWFFRDLMLPAPDHHLNAQTGSHAKVTGSTMIAYEELCLRERPDWTIVVGDVNSTIACALSAKKLGIRVAHLEAGLRSFDRSMPEEVNRVLTDAIADLLWTSSPEANDNLQNEGVPAGNIDFVGNIMIDSLEMLRDSFDGEPETAGSGLTPGQYGIVTLHRPANVDDPTALRTAISALARVARRLPLVFPVHPRTRQALNTAGLASELEAAGVTLLPPQGYTDFMRLVKRARIAITDSGGLQEETSHLGIPCLTLRPNTERPVTVTDGTNRLVDFASLDPAVADILAAAPPAPARIPLWDGQTAGRCAASLQRHLHLLAR